MVDEKKKLKKRLSMDIPRDIFIDMQLTCLRHNCTLTKWVIMAIIDRLKKENS